MFYSPEALLLLHHLDQARLYEQLLRPERPERQTRPGRVRRAWSAVQSIAGGRRPTEPVACVGPCAA
jgi:hypothetical protein